MKTKISELKFSGQPRRGSVYDALYEGLRSLKPGEAYVLPLGDVSNRVAHNRLNAALMRAGPKPPEGCRWSKRAIVGGGMAIYAKPLKSAAPAPAPAPAPQEVKPKRVRPSRAKKKVSKKEEKKAKPTRLRARPAKKKKAPARKR